MKHTDYHNCIKELKQELFLVPWDKAVIPSNSRIQYLAANYAKFTIDVGHSLFQFQ